MSSSSSAGSRTSGISLGSPDKSNLWYTEMYNYNYFMEKKNIIRGRKRYPCHYNTSWKKKKKKPNRPLLHTSEASNNCKDHPLVPMAANLSAPKSLKDFSSWQNSKTLQYSSYTHLLLHFRLKFFPGTGHRIPNAEGLCTSSHFKSTINPLQRLHLPDD